MFIRLVSFFILFSSLVQAEFNTTALDKYHADLCQILVESSERIDNYFIDTNISEERSQTKAELKTSFALETKQSSEYAMRLRLRLNLPKIQKKLRIIFEDEESDDLVNDGTSLNSNHKVKNENYFLRLEYFDYMVRNHNLSGGAGVRVRKSNLHPYFNIKARYVIEESEDRSSLVTNRFRVYIDGDIEDIISFNMLRHFDDTIYVLFRNNFAYRSWESEKVIINGLSATKVLGEKREVTLGVMLRSELHHYSLHISYPQLYGVYRDQLYKHWLYYELNPSLLWRDENSYDISARFMVNIGAIFETN